VAPGGILLVLAAKAATGADDDGPPWPLTRAELDAFGEPAGLRPLTVEEIAAPGDPRDARWRAFFTRGPSTMDPPRA
jgi:hypothetical protein